MKDEFTIVMLPYFVELIVADMPDSVRNLRFDAMRQVQD